MSSSDSCPVCLEEVNNKIIVTLTCNHSLHYECFQKLIKKLSACPICRADINLDTNRETPPEPQICRTFSTNQEKYFWDQEWNKKLPYPYLFSNNGRTIETTTSGRGMWAMVSKNPFEPPFSGQITVEFDENITYMSAALITEEERKTLSDKDFGSDFTTSPGLRQFIGKKKIEINLDMNARSALINNKSFDCVRIKQQNKLWLACTMKAPHSCKCTISQINITN